MNNVAVIGAQWGDEGKGKIVDWLSSRADVVVRFQGGHNAGHTLVIDGVEHKLSLLPSGVVRTGKLSLIGNGVVVDPWAFFAEVQRVAEKGVQISPQNLRIAENVPLILPSHGVIDRAREAAAAIKIGTTGRGIGPAYEDKIARRAVRLCDLADPALLKQKLEHQLAHHNILLRAYGVEEAAVDDVLQKLLALAPQLLPYAAPVWRELDAAIHSGKKILFEGAQGTLLDIDHGTYPFVTSSNTVAAGAASGAGLAPHLIGTVLGICKAYTTRVGSGPFPTEEPGPIGEHIGQRKEFGTVTGRKRRCGWFDAVLVRQAVKLGGITGLALTKLDVLDELEEIKLCTGYRWQGQTLDYLPASQTAQAGLEPVYETWPGWRQTTRGARKWEQLPDVAVRYVRRLEELVQIPVTLLSTSPEREDTILMQDPFTK